MTTIGREELRELLNKSWMTHDAMWFRHCAQECGMEKTNRINKAAIRSAAVIEARRLAKIFEVEKIDSFEGLYDFITKATDLIRADFMKFECSAPEKNLLRWRMHQCFAYEGVTRMGVIEQYECGIFERMKGWLEGLGIKYSIEPQIDGCMMHTDGECFRDFRFYFE
ncbi:MAG: DUF6125 family protein [Acidobacteriota bacterium]